MDDKDGTGGVPRFVGRRNVRAGEVAVGGDAQGAALAPGSRVVNCTTVNNVLPEVRWPLRVGAVPPLASSFQPRPALRALVEAARADGQDVVLAQPAESGRVLVGEGGVGKSQLAASYYLASGADLAVWTTAKGERGSWSRTSRRPRVGSGLRARTARTTRPTRGPCWSGCRPPIAVGWW